MMTVRERDQVSLSHKELETLDLIFIFHQYTNLSIFRYVLLHVTLIKDFSLKRQ